MTRERAIRLAEQWSEDHICSLREGEAEEYHKMFLAALREQEERSKGCEWCWHFQNDPQYLVSRGNGMYTEVILEFCPNCGADMREVDHA